MVEKSKRQGPIYDDYGMTQWYWLVRHRENFELGENTEIGAFTVIDASSGVRIEDDVKIGWSAVIMSHSSIDGKSGKVVLKKNCNVGTKTVVMPGVTIGENSTVGANSLVNKDIPPNEIWFGTPAKFFKKIEKD
ncbi:MAG: acyltransferase [Candidatus Woesearchaeota archaeon]|nr:MAG: acyltransferase [Candidatus Woesearchaeota archaeon]